MSESPRPNPWLRRLGIALVVLSLALLARQMVRHVGDLPPIEWRPALLWVMPAVLASSLLARVLQSLAWRFLLGVAGQSIGWIELLRVGLLTEVGKYVPSNIAHYAGRIELLHQHGISRATAVKLMVQEVALMVVAALCLAGSAAWLWPEVLAPLSGYLPRWKIVLALVGLSLLVAALGWRAVRDRLQWPRRPVQWVVRLVACAVLYGLFLILYGAPLGLLAWGMYGLDVPWGPLVGIWAVAWLGGFVTPGAPAGLGVRDLLLVTGLGVFWAAAPALAVTAVHRLLLTAADALAFVVGLLLGRLRKSGRSAPR